MGFVFIRNFAVLDIPNMEYDYVVVNQPLNQSPTPNL